MESHGNFSHGSEDSVSFSTLVLSSLCFLRIENQHFIFPLQSKTQSLSIPAKGQTIEQKKGLIGSLQ